MNLLLYGLSALSFVVGLLAIRDSEQLAASAFVICVLFFCTGVIVETLDRISRRSNRDDDDT